MMRGSVLKRLTLKEDIKVELVSMFQWSL